MKIIKLLFAAFVVFSVVVPALAFRFGVGNLYTCDQDNQKCDIVDTRNFVIDNQHGTSFTMSALSNMDLSNQNCSAACPSTIKLRLE